MMESNERIGKYLQNLIRKHYATQSKFCAEWFSYRKDIKEARDLENQLSSIIHGRNAIQIEDLLIFAELLGVTCEEILTAGKKSAPESDHLNNYNVAFSKDEELWEEYANHPEKLILNADEYNKTVIDYAIEFGNYKFLKYLIDNEYISFSDNGNESNCFLFSADSKIKRRNNTELDCATIKRLNDVKLRSDLISLAIENSDTSTLDMLRAREIPYPYYNIRQYAEILDKYRSDRLIVDITSADKCILEYFGEAFEPEFAGSRDSLIFPYIGEVIDKMLLDGRNQVRILLKAAIEHNKNVLERIQEIADCEYKDCIKDTAFLRKISREVSGNNTSAPQNVVCLNVKGIDDNGEPSAVYYQEESIDLTSPEIHEKIMDSVYYRFFLDKSKSFVEYYSYIAKKNVLCNIVCATQSSKNSETMKLVDELNDIYNQIISCNREEG